MDAFNNKVTIQAEGLNIALKYVVGSSINRDKIKSISFAPEPDSSASNNNNATNNSSISQNGFQFPSAAFPDKPVISKIILQAKESMKQASTSIVSDLMTLDLQDAADGSKIVIKNLN